MSAIVGVLGIILGYYAKTIKNNNELIYKMLIRYYENPDLIEAKKYIEKYSIRMNNEINGSTIDLTEDESVVCNELRDKLFGNEEFNEPIDAEARKNIDLLICYYMEAINICGKGAASLIEGLKSFKDMPSASDYIKKYYPMEKEKFDLFCKRYRYANYDIIARFFICYKICKNNKEEQNAFIVFLKNFFYFEGLNEIKIKNLLP